MMLAVPVVGKVQVAEPPVPELHDRRLSHCKLEPEMVPLLTSMTALVPTPLELLMETLRVSPAVYGSPEASTVAPLLTTTVLLLDVCDREPM